MFLQGRGSDRGLGGGEKAVEAGETCLQVTDGFGTSHPRLLRKPWDFRRVLGYRAYQKYAHFQEPSWVF